MTTRNVPLLGLVTTIAGAPGTVYALRDALASAGSEDSSLLCATSEMSWSTPFTRPVMV